MTRYGFLSTYPPTRCGLATFTEALATAVAADPEQSSAIVRVLDTAAPPAIAPSEPGVSVVADLVADEPASIRYAARALNACDVAIVQHEYGIYGGPDGDQVLAVLDAVTVPVIVVLHTVLALPTAHQKQVFDRLGELATEIVVMTDAALALVRGVYDVDVAKMHVIPHGVAPWAAPATQAARPTRHILTWGLIGPGKGIEWAIQAMALLGDLRPAVRYTVAGQTHPKVLANDGDAYRESLQRSIDELDVSDTVKLDARYLGTAELSALVASADVVLLPYDSLEQVTSGVLVEAIAAGIPVVATGFPHALELLSGHRDRIAEHKNPHSMAAALRTVLTAPRATRVATASGGPDAGTMSWVQVAARYRALATRSHAMEAA